MYEIRARYPGETKYQGYFSAETIDDIVSLAAQLPGMEFKIQTVGHAIETIYHPHKGTLVQRILEQTMCQAPADCPFEFKVYDWNRYANDTNESIASVVNPKRNATEAIIRWTFDHLIQSFKIDTISVSVAKNDPSRCRYTVRVLAK